MNGYGAYGAYGADGADGADGAGSISRVRELDALPRMALVNLTKPFEYQGVGVSCDHAQP